MHLAWPHPLSPFFYFTAAKIVLLPTLWSSFSLCQGYECKLPCLWSFLPQSDSLEPGWRSNTLPLVPKDNLRVRCHEEEGKEEGLPVNHWPADHNAHTSCPCSDASVCGGGGRGGRESLPLVSSSSIKLFYLKNHFCIFSYDQTLIVGFTIHFYSTFGYDLQTHNPT